MRHAQHKDRESDVNGEPASRSSTHEALGPMDESRALAGSGQTIVWEREVRQKQWQQWARRLVEQNDGSLEPRIIGRVRLGHRRRHASDPNSAIQQESRRPSAMVRMMCSN
jgi:hypothetical protein